MWIGDKVIYTPEAVTITKLASVKATVESINARDGSISLLLDSGEVVKAEAHQVINVNI